MIKTAVIMAAGLGSRFGHMTETMPKGFIECGGKAMVVRSIEALIACGIERIIIGTGYKKEAYEQLASSFPQIECVFSPRYAETNSMFTLWNCREAIGNDDFLLLESDIIFSRNALTELIDDAHPDIMLITPVTKFQDQYYVEYDANGTLTRCSTDRDAIDADAVRCFDADSSARMLAEIDAAKADGDTLGGVVEVVVTGLPPGVGSHIQGDRRLDARLAGAGHGNDRDVHRGRDHDQHGRHGTAPCHGRSGKAGGSCRSW